MEIIVSDNCSQDATPKVVEDFSKKFRFTYLRHSENLGPDGNFLQCLKVATGTYVWLLGDDDFICIDNMSKLINLLYKKQYGLVHISNVSKKKIIHKCSSHDDYVSKLGIWLTFMSSNIFRRINATGVNYEPFSGTNLVQVPMYLESIFKSKESIILNDHFIDAAVESATNGGYNIMRVFVKNFIDILENYKERGLSSHTMSVLRNKVSDFIFPYIFNLILLRKDSNFDTKGAFALLREYLGLPRIVLSALKFFFSLQMLKLLFRKSGTYIKNYVMNKLLRASMKCYPLSVAEKIGKFKDAFVSYRFSQATATPDVQSYIHGSASIKGGKFVTLGQHFSSLSDLRIECIQHGTQKPQLIIGNNVSFGYRVHIGVSNSIRIGDNVLLGSNILITDHSHGSTDEVSLSIPPTERTICSKGPIVIEDDVWIGENAIILPNVTIGKGSIIGAGAIVTHSVPPYSRVVGTAAKVME